MKNHRLAAAVMLLLCLLCSVTVHASDTELTTTVPAEHTVQLKIDGRGSVVINGVPYSANATLSVKRFSTLAVKFLPSGSSTLYSVAYKDNDVTSLVKDGVFTSDEVTEDVTISVSFKDTQNKLPQTGNVYPVWSCLLFLAGVLCIVLGKRKHKKSK